MHVLLVLSDMSLKGDDVAGLAATKVNETCK